MVWEQFQAARGEARPQTEDRRADYQRRAAERMAQQAKIEADQAATYLAASRAAAQVAEDVWLTARECERHFYLEAKGVPSHGLRVATQTMKARLWKVANERWETTIVARPGELLIPMFDADGNLWNVQRIEALPLEGKHARWFLAGSRKRGLFYRIGGEGPAWMAEGYATAATVHAATGMPVFVGFDAYNMPAVARQFAGTIVAIAADNDRNGAGTIAAKSTGLPFFAPPTVGHDWNDHSREFGLASVRELLGAFHAG
jgi:putative DNA primase/helicase